LPPVLRRDSQIVNPASVTLITCHAGGNDLAVNDAHQKPFRVHLEFSFDVSLGIVLRDDQIALQPELKDGCLILSLIRSNHQVIHDCAPMPFFFFSAARIEPDIKPFVDLPLVFRAEDRESATFRCVAHMRSPARLRIKPLDLYDADLAVRNRRFDLQRPEQIVALSEFLLRDEVGFHGVVLVKYGIDLLFQF
jgi:hypothetical protein